MVALRKESVDRNLFRLVHMLECTVALHTVSVERNLDLLQKLVVRGRSLNARRAWIEMTGGRSTCAAALVALRKESVDRNHHVCQSASAGWVALRKESVDRNYWPDL